MKKNLLILSIAAILAAPSAFAARTTDTLANTGTTDDADDLQQVTVSVPEVALLDISNSAVTLDELTAPTDAGTGFTGTVSDNVTTFALSSNVLANSAQTRKITAAITTGAIPENATLTIATTGAGNGGSAALTKETISGDAASGIKNEKTAGGNITYTFGPTNSGDMVAYTAGTDITITYTLTSDS
ncbi:MAG: hypothetical protein WBM66_02545 [Thiothrix litoralis]